MKLFFDENLSPKLVHLLADHFPACSHVTFAGLKGDEDLKIWDFCRKNSFIIVSKDTDFRERSFLEGYPPKIIWLNVGNAGTLEIANLLKKEKNHIAHFVKQQQESLLILSIGDKII